MTKSNKNDPRGSHGTDIFEDRGMKYATKVQEVPMADGTTPRGKYGYGKGKIEDSLIMGEQGVNSSQRKSKGQSVIDEAKKRWPQGGSY